jgi:serine/threonine protein kinase
VLKPGDVVGGTYRLKTLIGQGGMGYVFSAEHTIIKRDYALKVMAPECINEVNWRRFESEGRAIAALNHGNIVKVYNMGVDEGDCPYIVMDLLHGHSLADMIRRGHHFQLEEILDIFIGTSNGLEYAHSKGIVHRDIKPSNIMLVQGAQGAQSVRLVDFGLAKLVKEERHKNHRVTGTGDVFGSPYYMSPEQCMGTDVDARSDIYSLGCALYETVMGHPPYCGGSALETVLSHMNDRVPGFDQVFDDHQAEQRMNLLLARMMAKKIEERYQSMAQVAHDLERIRGQKDIGRQNVQVASAAPVRKIPQHYGQSRPSEDEFEAESVGGTWIRPALLLAVALALLGLIGLGGYMLLSPKHPGGHNQAQAATEAPNSSNARANGDPSDRTMKASEPDFSVSAMVLDKNLGSAQVFDHPDRPIAAAAFKKIKTIDATVVNNVKTVHFPSYTLGELTTPTRQCEARGDQIVGINEPIQLEINWCHSPQSMLNLDVFGKIARDLLTSLIIKGNALDVGDGKFPDIQLPAVKTVLREATKWTRLIKLKIDDLASIDGDDELLSIIDRMPLLKTFTVGGARLQMKQLSTHKFIRRLTKLDIDTSPADVDSLLSALAGSTVLNELSLESSEASPAAISKLRTCPNLKLLRLRSRTFTQQQLEAVSKLSSLNEVVLIGLIPTPANLHILSGLPKTCIVQVNVPHATESEKQTWLRLLPNSRYF